MVHAVLRGSPSRLAWSSSERNPTSIRTCPSSRILADWRAFISAMTGRAGLVCVDSHLSACWRFLLSAGQAFFHRGEPWNGSNERHLPPDMMTSHLDSSFPLCSIPRMAEWGELFFKVVRLESAGAEGLAKAGNILGAKGSFDIFCSL